MKRAVWLGYIKDDSSEYEALEEEIQTIQKTLKNHKNNQTLMSVSRKVLKIFSIGHGIKLFKVMMKLKR